MNSLSHRSTLKLVSTTKMQASTPTHSGTKSDTPKSIGRTKGTTEAKKRTSTQFKLMNKSMSATLFHGVEDCCNYHFSSDTVVPALMSRIKLTNIDYYDADLPAVDRLFHQISFWYLTGYTYHALIQNRFEILAVVTNTPLTDTEANEPNVPDAIRKFFEDRNVATTLADALIAMALNPKLALKTTDLKMLFLF
jgi:hypothetical protein